MQQQDTLDLAAATHRSSSIQACPPPPVPGRRSSSSPPLRARPSTVHWCRDRLRFGSAAASRSGHLHPPELKLNIPAQVFCMSWCADFEFRGMHNTRFLGWHVEFKFSGGRTGPALGGPEGGHAGRAVLEHPFERDRDQRPEAMTRAPGGYRGSVVRERVPADRQWPLAPRRCERTPPSSLAGPSMSAATSVSALS